MKIFRCSSMMMAIAFGCAVYGVAGAQDSKIAPVAERLSADQFVGVERAFSHLRFHRPVLMIGCGDGSGRLFVVEQDGVIQVFNQNDEHPTAKVFLDIRDRISRRGNEEGLIGIAFHPDYENNGLLFVHYSSLRDQGDKEVAPNVIASFRVSDTDPDQIDPNSERVIMTIDQPFANHNGGMIAFGKDGYLYVSLGDGGKADDPFGNGQNVETLLGAILRIDVDRQDGGKSYAIPKDNPFLDHPKARPELFAIGLRNVWRFSIDRESGEIWAADVGQNLWEEVNIVTAGGNYGWNRMEAKSDFATETEIATGSLEQPVAIYGHQWGGSITGGYVYRGKKFPALRGSYFYGDYMTGNLWQIRKNEQGDYENRLVRRTGRSIASFGEDDNGEVFVLSFDGGIYRIVPTAEPEATFANWPAKLSDTELFESVKNGTVSGDLIPYYVNAPFWSDNAEKSRYFGLPEGKKLVYREDGSWEVPVGATIVKNFQMSSGRKNRFLETRLIKRTETGWESATYVWDKRNQDAELLVNGKQFELWSREGVKSWHAPSSSECSSCHVEAAGYVLGLTTSQLNRAPEGGKGNQILNWAKAGIVDLPENFDLTAAAKFCSPFDESADLATRAKVYMDVNCAMCHRPLGPGNANIDLRFTTPVDQMKIVNQKPAQGDLGLEGALLVQPGEPEQSLMLQRINTLSQGRMPNIGSNVVDEKGVELLSNWIKSLQE